MQNKYLISLLFIVASLAAAPAQAAKSIGYWYDSSGNVVHNPFGKCWRSIHWTPSNALPECERGMPRKVAAADSDRDGVIDSRDRCKNTARGVAVDARGCDLGKDSDRDGIADAKDDCPGTRAGTVVNRRGCKLKADISLENVQFRSGTAELSSDSRNILDGVAKTLRSNTHLNFEVAGHTDNTGNYQYNVSLSDKRAKSVRQYLINKGVAAGSLTARGYGPDKPVASNNTSAGRKLNRRVELVRR